MSRKPNAVAKTSLNCSITSQTKAMLVEKSEACGQTISELVEIAAVEKYSPSKGLAKRLANTRADAKLDLDQKLVALESHRLEALVKLEAEHSMQVQFATQKHDMISKRCDAEWENSLQKLLLSFDLESEFPALNRALFDRGIWCITGLGSKVSASGLLAPRFFGGRLCHGIVSVMKSPLYPDMYLAADVAADLTMWTVTPEYLDFMLQHYEMSTSKLYDAFDSAKGSEQYSELMGLMQKAEDIYKTGLYSAACGC